MLKKWMVSARNWIVRVLAPVVKKLLEPAADREFAVIDDYLRIQNLRRMEEDRFRRAYWGTHRL